MDSFICHAIILITCVASVACWRSPELMDRFIGCPYRTAQCGDWHRLVSSGFLHADLPHLFFNMFTFHSFGSNLLHMLSWEEGFVGRMPSFWFLVLYLAGILSANVFSFFYHRKDPYYTSLGASAGVVAVVSASILLDPLTEVTIFAFMLPLPIKGYMYLIGYLGFSFYKRHSGEKISHRSHFIGGVCGLVLMTLLAPNAVYRGLSMLFAGSVAG